MVLLKTHNQLIYITQFKDLLKVCAMQSSAAY